MRNPSPSSCVFCTKHPTSYILETEHFFAVYDAHPVREGHLLVIPLRHVERLKELTQEEFVDLHAMIGEVEELVKVQHEADGYNVGLNDGLAAGQTVPHLHFHIVPRKFGDVADPRGGIRHFLPNL